jgi:hypothetical protein
MPLVVVGLVLTFLVTAVSFIAPILGAILSVFWLCVFVGSLVFIHTRSKAAGIIAIIGFVIFAPLGLVGAVGIRQMMDKEAAKTSDRDSEEKCQPEKQDKEEKISQEKEENVALLVYPKVYLYNRWAANFMLCVGIPLFVLIVLVLLATDAGGGGGSAAPGIMIVAGFLFRSLKILTIYPDHFVLKLAPLAAKRLINNRDVEKVEVDKKYITVYLKAEKKPIKIATILFNQKERAEVTVFFQSLAFV